MSGAIVNSNSENGVNKDIINSGGGLIRCPSCGGTLQFYPETGKVKCDYCRSEFEVEQLGETSSTTGRQGAQDTHEGEMLTYSCPSCGAELVSTKTSLILYCYYCNNALVEQGRLSGELKPDGILPFTIDKKTATEKFLAWAKKHKLTPKNFFSKEQIERIAGVYQPYWVIDIKADGVLQATATQVRTSVLGNMQTRETTEYNVERSGALHFPGIVENALSDTDRRLAEAVLPYNFDTAKPFHPAYFLGFSASMRDIEKADLEQIERVNCEKWGGQVLTSQVTGYSTVTPTNIAINIKQMNWRYLLFPVWTLSYRSGDKLFHYALNGVSGEVSGILPVSKSKMTWLFIAVTLGIFAVIGALLWWLL